MAVWRRKRPIRTATRMLPGAMNKTERAYADQQLGPWVSDNTVLGWRFESVKLRLADLTWYTPDFWLQMAAGSVQIHEVKACRSDGTFLCEDDAKVKIKVAAEIYHEMDFWLVGLLPKKSGGGWRYERVSKW